MPEGVGYGPQYTASTGLSLNYVGKRAYAYSGGVAINNTTAECLNFTTGKETLMATFYFSMDYTSITGGSTAGFEIKLNDVTIIKQNDQISTSYEGLVPKKIKFLIPPLTNVTTIGITNSSTANTFYHTLTGKIQK